MVMRRLIVDPFIEEELSPPNCTAVTFDAPSVRSLDFEKTEWDYAE